MTDTHGNLALNYPQNTSNLGICTMETKEVERKMAYSTKEMASIVGVAVSTVRMAKANDEIEVMPLPGRDSFYSPETLVKFAAKRDVEIVFISNT